MIRALNRRQLLLAPALAAAFPPAHGLARTTLQFPRDAGSHNDFQTEWWYVTGCALVPGATGAGGAAQMLGFQVTFFRSRIASTQGMQSRLAARQLLFAHAAATDVDGKKLWHDQRISRWSGEAPGRNPADLASASSTDTAITLRDWRLLREGPDLRAQITGAGFTLDLRLQASQPVLLQGADGLSRKGPEEKQASYYYSLPQLRVIGSIALQGKTLALQSGSTAWLDHEWSQEMLHPQAVGWDWIGINLFDGSALTAFQLRDKTGAALWDGGSFRSGGAGAGDGAVAGKNRPYIFSRGEVVFKPLRRWTSPLSRASYPVEWMVRTPADFYTVKAMLDNQELDSRNSTGAIYWEGLCEVWDSNNRLVGRGYLEMTGYAGALQM
ncbi:carotenoid 1,2-hydratase [Rhodoferax sp. OV413]|uniref:lipocalin-like domain-containing protein n=1 Tax=Rhodoferax sp. OV413 TaxID=1855285 RepID=UPI0025E0AF96|nr:carotenoid 1,2-hydratase [Rhodoferax sp. OV413]